MPGRRLTGIGRSEPVGQDSNQSLGLGLGWRGAASDDGLVGWKRVGSGREAGKEAGLETCETWPKGLWATLEQVDETRGMEVD